MFHFVLNAVYIIGSPIVNSFQDKTALQIDAKWTAYSGFKQNDIAASDSLLQITADYQVLKQAVTDSINAKKQFFTALDEFDKAEAYIMSQDSAYATIYDDLLPYSLTEKLGKQLDSLKAVEKQTFGQLQGYHASAQALAAQYNGLNERYVKMDAAFARISTESQKVQELKYQPLLDRIKDYIYSIAAVAMILMFVNMIQTKIKSYKQFRESAEKMAKNFNGDGEEYPTI